MPGSLPGHITPVIAQQRNCLKPGTASSLTAPATLMWRNSRQDQTRGGIAMGSVGLGLAFGVLKPRLSTSSSLLSLLEKPIQVCRAALPGVTNPAARLCPWPIPCSAQRGRWGAVALLSRGFRAVRRGPAAGREPRHTGWRCLCVPLSPVLHSLS